MSNKILISIFMAFCILLIISIVGIFIHPFAWIISIPTSMISVSFLWKTVKVIREMDINN